MATKGVINFAPEALEFYRTASTKPIRLEFKLERSAIRARQRLYDLRKALRREDHHLVAVAEQVQLRVVEGDDGQWFLEGRPADTEESGLVGALRAAGIRLPSADEAEATEPPESGTAPDLMERFRKEHGE